MKVWEFLGRQYRPYAGRLTLSAIGISMWGFGATVQFYLFGELINAMGSGRSWSHVLPWVVGLVVFWLIGEAFYRGAGFIYSYAMPQVRGSVRSAMFARAMSHSIGYFQDRLSGSISNKINDMVDAIEEVYEMAAFAFFPLVVGLCVLLTVFAIKNPFFALVILLWFVLHITIITVFRRWCQNFSNLRAELRSKVVGVVVDAIANISTVKLFSRESAEAHRLRDFQKQEIAADVRTKTALEWMRLAMALSMLVGPAVGVLLLAIAQWVRGEIDAGDVVFISGSTWHIIDVTWYVSQEIPKFIRTWGVAKQAMTIFDDPVEVVDQGDVSLRVAAGEIRFDHVNFAYRGQEVLFANKNVVIPGGQKVGLVGHSGSGKTTFVNALLRVWDVQSGKILIDGQDIAQCTQKSLHEAISFIPQDPSLFHRSLHENIAYGKPEATIDEVVHAAQAAHADEFIKALPRGYDTPVGERGVKLSGGQRQRVAIARALLKAAPILVLDEATSALDSATESKIQESLHRLMQGRTTIVVAHRLSTLLHMDRILVFEKGRIVEDGTHEQLLAKNGLYTHFWKHQTIAPNHS